VFFSFAPLHTVIRSILVDLLVSSRPFFFPFILRTSEVNIGNLHRRIRAGDCLTTACRTAPIKLKPASEALVQRPSIAAPLLVSALINNISVWIPPQTAGIDAAARQRQARTIAVHAQQRSVRPNRPAFNAK
jgi:hypothetical protein